MAQTALPAPRVVVARRRAFFGLFDAGGWPWATVKALGWFILIIILLAYIPDRAYYFTVQKTVDLGLLVWSPVNFCPPENETLPCPAPAGATLPWHPSPAEIQFPAGRTDGAAALIGTAYLYAGGSDGKAAVATTLVSHAVGLGNLDKWSEGPPLPAPRSDAAYAVLGNTLYVIGGYGADGAPARTTYSLTIGTDGTLGEWKVEDALTLPGPRAGASAVAVSDGLVVVGGTDGTAPTRSVWKSLRDLNGKMAAWVEQRPMVEENMDGVAMRVGDVIFVVGGRNLSGQPVASVQQGLVGGGPAATAKDPNVIEAWRLSEQTNLPVARSNMAGFTANGVLYVQGGSDAASPQSDTWWAVPNADGVIPAWHTLPQLALGQGLDGATGIASASNGFILGGRTSDGITTSAARANLAPQTPFFQVGILGATIPGLKLDGETGQQIGYLLAATIGAANFVLLLLVGWAFAHPDRVRELRARRRRRDRKG